MRAKRTVGLEIFDGHKLGGLGVSLGNGSCRLRGEKSDRRLSRAASLRVQLVSLVVFESSGNEVRERDERMERCGVAWVAETV